MCLITKAHGLSPDFLWLLKEGPFLFCVFLFFLVFLVKSYSTDLFFFGLTYWDLLGMIFAHYFLTSANATQSLSTFSKHGSRNLPVISYPTKTQLAAVQQLLGYLMFLKAQSRLLILEQDLKKPLGERNVATGIGSGTQLVGWLVLRERPSSS